MLSLLVIDPSHDRRKAHTEHLSKRFNVRTTPTADRATAICKELQPDIVLCAFRLNRGNGLLLCSSMRPTCPGGTLIVYGASTARKKARRNAKEVDVCLPHFPRAEQLEVLALHNFVSRHQETDASSPEQVRHWKELRDKEPMLEHISTLIRTNDSEPEDVLIQQIKKRIQTGRATSLADQQTPLVVVSEPDHQTRQELISHFAGRLRMVFVAHPADLPQFVRRQPVAAAIIHQAQFEAALIPRIRNAQAKSFPIIAHGTNQDLPVDRRVQNNMSPPLLEVVIWEEMTRFNSFENHKSMPPTRTKVRVQSANRSDEEVAARSTWKELLNSKVSLANIRRLLIKEVNS